MNSKTIGNRKNSGKMRVAKLTDAFSNKLFYFKHLSETICSAAALSYSVIKASKWCTSCDVGRCSSTKIYSSSKF